MILNFDENQNKTTKTVYTLYVEAGTLKGCFFYDDFSNIYHVTICVLEIETDKWVPPS